MIHAIIFDCFGVIYADPIKELQALVADESQDAFLDICRSYDYGYITKAEYVSRLSELTGQSGVEIDRLTTVYHMRNDELIQSIMALKPSYKIGLLSNMGRSALDDLFGANDRALFDEILVSGVVGLAKPDPAIFTLAAERLGCKPNECIMIDDAASNCNSAESTGMRSILYMNVRQCLHDLEVIGVERKSA